MVDLRWETSSTVLSRHSARTALRITPSFRLSRLEVGSSSSRKGASCRNARATPMRCRSPPDKAPPSSPTGVSYPLGRLRIKPSSAAFLQAASTSSRVASRLAMRMLFSMVSLNSSVSWVTRLSCARKVAVFTRRMSSSPKRMVPVFTSQKRMSSRRKVDLPLPERPVMPTIFFSGMVRLRSCSTSSSA